MTDFEVALLSLAGFGVFVLLLIYGRLNRIHADIQKAATWQAEDQKELINLLTEALTGGEQE